MAFPGGSGDTSSSRTETVRGARQGLAGEAGPGAVGGVPFQSACPAGSSPCRGHSQDAGPKGHTQEKT